MGSSRYSRHEWNAGGDCDATSTCRLFHEQASSFHVWPGTYIATRVSTYVNRPANEGPGCVEPDKG